MGNRYSSRTIAGMRAGVSTTSNRALANLSQQRKRATQLSRSTNIGGNYAQAFSRYVRNGINGAINGVSNLTNQMTRTMSQISQACNQFERSSTGVVDEGALNGMCAKLSSMSQDIGGLQSEINSALSAASKYISPVPVNLHSVASGYQRVISGLRRIIGDLHKLNSTINNYANIFYSNIASAQGLIRQLGSCYTPSKGFNINKIGDYIFKNPAIQSLVTSGQKTLGGWYKWATQPWKPPTIDDFRNSVKSFNNKYIIPAGNNFGSWVRATVGPTGRDIKANTHVVYEDTGVWKTDSEGNHMLAGAHLYYQPGGGNTKWGLNIKTFYIGTSGAGLVSENVYVDHKQTVQISKNSNITINANAGVGANFFGAGGKGINPVAGGLNADAAATYNYKNHSYTFMQGDYSHKLSSNLKDAKLTKNSNIKVFDKEWQSSHVSQRKRR